MKKEEIDSLLHSFKLYGKNLSSGNTPNKSALDSGNSNRITNLSQKKLVKLAVQDCLRHFEHKAQDDLNKLKFACIATICKVFRSSQMKISFSSFQSLILDEKTLKKEIEVLIYQEISNSNSNNSSTNIDHNLDIESVIDEQFSELVLK